MSMIKFIYSQKATKFCKISTILLSYVVPVKSKVEIAQNFEAFSEYKNFNDELKFLIFIWYFIADEASNKSKGGPVAADTLQLKNMLNGNATKMKETKNNKAVLNFDEENEITIIGYHLVYWKWFLTMVAMVGSAGLLWLLLYWMPQWKLWWTHEQAQFIYLDSLSTT